MKDPQGYIDVNRPVETKWYMDSYLIKLMIEPIEYARIMKNSGNLILALEQYQNSWNILKTELDGTSDKDILALMEETDDVFHECNGFLQPTRTRNMRLKRLEESENYYLLGQTMKKVEYLIFRCMKKSPLWLKYKKFDNKPAALGSDDE